MKSEANRSKETLFQVAYQNQVNLIMIADNKANMIISINTLIISSIIGVTGYGAVSDKIQYGKWSVIIPVILIVLTCLVSAILAVLAARPKVVSGNNFNNLSVAKSSLLFFGRIARHSQDDYVDKIENLLQSETEIYRNLALDIYNQGLILERKYHLLSYAYNVFMAGFILSVMTFLLFLTFG